MGLFAAPDHLLFLRDATLMAQRFDTRRFELQGDPFPIAEDVGFAVGNGVAGIAASDTGVLAYRISGTTDRILRWVDRKGQPLGDVGPVGYYENVAVAPQGDRLAETRPQRGAGDLWTIDLRRGSSSQFTFDAPALDDSAVWSPNGQEILFASTRNGLVRNLYRKKASGAEPAELVLATDHAKVPTDWSRDGDYLLYTEGPGPWRVWALPLRGNRTPIPYLNAPFDQSGARFSPDGRWVAYTSAEADTFRVNVQSFPHAGGRWQVSVSEGPACHPRWRGDGRELFYTTGTAIWAVDIDTSTPPTLTMGVPRKLFDANVLYAGSPVNTGYDVTPDGQRFLLIAQNTSATRLNRPIRVVLNWTTPSGS
jgi:Tol biopolymer transport system component